MDWQKIEVTTHQIAQGILDKLLNDFIKATLKPNVSMDKVGVFASGQFTGKMSLFFTPNATIALFLVIAPYLPQPCPSPTEQEVEAFLFGDQSCWELLS